MTHTIIVGAPDGEAVVCATNIAATKPEVAAAIARSCETAGFRPTVVMVKLVPAWRADGPRQSDLLKADLNAFDAETFVAAWLIATHEPAGAPVKFSPDSDRAEALAVLGRLQAQALTLITHRWLERPDRAIEPDLRLNVPSGGLVPGTADKAVRALTAMLAYSLSTPFAHALNALLASVCAEARRANPNAQEWARLWLRNEVRLELRQNAEPSADNLDGLSLEVQRAHASATNAPRRRSAAKSFTTPR